MRCLESKIRKNAFATGDPPRTPLRMLTALPTSLTGFFWNEKREGGRKAEGNEGERKGKEMKGRGLRNAPKKNSGYVYACMQDRRDEVHVIYVRKLFILYTV